MGFRSSIERSLRSKSSARSLVHSGVHICVYPELGSLLDAVETSLHRQGLRQGTVVEYRCPNTLAGALGLLALLRRETSFYLTSPEPLDSRDRPIGFCDRILRVAGEDLGRPGELFAVEPHPGFRAPAAGLKEGGQMLVKTSGSLGNAKLVVHSQHTFEANVRRCAERLQLEAEHRIMLPVPIYHLYGLGAGFLPGFVSGASIALVENANLLTLLECEDHFDPDVTFLTPALCEASLAVRKSPRPYRLTVCAGDVLSEEAFRAYERRHGPLVNLYGTSELGVIATTSSHRATEPDGAPACRPLPGVAIRIEPGEEQNGDGNVGEIAVGHPAGFEAYVDRDGASLAFDGRLRADGHFATGDLGRERPDGTFEVLGRCDLSVNRDGRLILFSDIESRIEEVGGVERALVLSTGRHARGSGLLACCLPRRGQRLDLESLRARCSAELPRFAVPDEVVVLEKWPLLANGKVDREALKTLVASRVEDEGSP